ncbi:MAG: iron-containing alcohol dehydrogenase [Betaproteobacteria bacterium]
MAIYRFAFPTDIHFGAGARREAGPYLVARGCRRALIVTDQGIAALPMLAEFKSTLGGLAVDVYAGVVGNPVKSQVDAGVAAFKSHRADAVIGFGGGAALDVAKAVALMAEHPGSVLEYAWDHPQVRAIERDLPCFIALPTTAGTGSEVGRSSVISDDATHVKKIIFSARLLAKAVFADPELTLDLSPQVTAATGMDALTHNVESYIAKGYHPMCDGIALEGVRIAARALPVAVREPRNLEARADMLMASLMGAVAFQKDLGATHSCAHALSTVADLHHGLANGIMIDYVMRFNQPVELERFALMAQAAGVARDSVQASAQAFVDWLTALKREVGIPAKLGAVKVSRQHLPKLLDVAVADICHQTNPRPCARADFERIFTEAL